MVEHAAVNRGVVGSSPTGGAKQRRHDGGGAVPLFLGIPLLGPLAQLVEHLTLNQGVQGSSP